MPVVVRKQGNKFRVVESSSGKVAKTAGGGAADGGGHATQQKANRQARAINRSLSLASRPDPQRAARSRRKR